MSFVAIQIVLCHNITAIQQHHNITTSRCHNITITQHHDVTTSRCHNITTSQHHKPQTHITTIQQYIEKEERKEWEGSGKEVGKEWERDVSMVEEEVVIS